MRVAMGIAFVCALALGTHARAADPADNHTQTTVTEPSEGRLITRHAGDQVGDQVIDVPLEHTEVSIRVQGFLADATVSQTFHNPYDHKIEAVYLFPLPTSAAVHHMEIAIGDRIIEGTIERKHTAERIYKRARQQGHVAALLTQERPNLFTQSVANIEPGARIRVSLRYVQPLVYERGGYELSFPMVAGPRYLPHGDKDTRIQPSVLPPGLRSSHDIDLRVELDAGVPIQGLTSPSHELVITSGDRPSRAQVAIAASDTIPNKDFILRYQVAGAAPTFAVLAERAAHRPASPALQGPQGRQGRGGRGSFYFLAQPPSIEQTKGTEHTQGLVSHREIIFVLDTSSSMAGAPLDKAKQLIRRVLSGLRAHDTFQIVRFADTAGALGQRPIANKASNVRYTLEWLDSLQAQGGTAMSAGIDAALAVPHDPARLRIVVFVTDGYIGNEDQILARVAADMGESRLFSFGVGSAVNRYLLEEMANMGRGDTLVVRPDEDTEAAVKRLYQRIDRPVLTDIRIDWHGLDVHDVVPARVPDLFAGQPLVLSGHYGDAGRATVTVHGKRAGREVRFDVPVVFPDQASGPSAGTTSGPSADTTSDTAVRMGKTSAVATVWARARIAEISRSLLRKHGPGVAEKLENELIELALEHELMTRYTAFVAVDRSRVTEGGPADKVTVPVEVPDQVRRITPGTGTATGYGGGSGTYGSIGQGVGHGIGVAPMILSPSRGRVAASSVPRVSLGGHGEVTGHLDAAIVRRIMRRHLLKFRRCYEVALQTDATLAVNTRVRFTILPSGQVTAVQVANLADQKMSRCMTQVISSMRFPSVAESERDRIGSVTITYPILFKSTAE